MSEPVPHSTDLLRVGDAERQQAVTALGDHFAAGRLDQDEYDTRVQAAYAARTQVDLRGLFGDLPEPAPFRAAVAVPAGATRRPDRRRLPAPVFPALLILALVLSAVLKAPIFPLVLVVWFLAGRQARY